MEGGEGGEGDDEDVTIMFVENKVLMMYDVSIDDTGCNDDPVAATAPELSTSQHLSNTLNSLVGRGVSNNSMDSDSFHKNYSGHKFNNNVANSQALTVGKTELADHSRHKTSPNVSSSDLASKNPFAQQEQELQQTVTEETEAYTEKEERVVSPVGHEGRLRTDTSASSSSMSALNTPCGADNSNNNNNSSTLHVEGEASTALHVGLTLLLWSTSLGVALVAKKLGVVSALTGLCVCKPINLEYTFCSFITFFYYCY
jgi:hypothetical protein